MSDPRTLFLTGAALLAPPVHGAGMARDAANGRRQSLHAGLIVEADRQAGERARLVSITTN